MRATNSPDPHKAGPAGRIGKLPLSVGAVRGVAEAVLLFVVLGLLVYAAVSQNQSGVDASQTLTLGPLCAILCAVRLRLRTGGRRSVLLGECATGAAFAVLVGASSLLILAAYMEFSTEQRSVLLLVLPFLCAWHFGAFAFFRTTAYLWPRWMRLRRSRLRWEMTHTTLLAVAGVSFALILAFMVLLLAAPVFTNGGSSPPGQLVELLPLFGILIFLSVIAMGVVLPLAALVSYFTARRTARRLEALAHGTSGLREGNFDIRVEVDGEDEVSDLQKDFNAMADDLGGAVRDLRSERDNVERLLATQRELVASVSHELRTPVATMRGYLESALGDATGDATGDAGGRGMPESLRGDLEIVERETVRLQRLIDDLFVLSRAESGKLSLQTSPTDVPALLSRCVEAVSGPAWTNGRVEVVLTETADPPLVLADEGRLEQVVRNLLANAVRHTPPGGLVALGASAEPAAEPDT